MLEGDTIQGFVRGTWICIFIEEWNSCILNVQDIVLLDTDFMTRQWNIIFSGRRMPLGAT